MKTLPSDPPRRIAALPKGPASYTDEGQGKTVVAIHGLPGSARDFRWLAPHLTDNVRLIRPELPGFGETPVQTEPDPSPLGRARFVLDLVSVLELDRPLLLGHSMGGVVVTAAAELSPEQFRAIALVSSPGMRQHPLVRRVPFRALTKVLSLPRLGPALSPIVRRAFALGGFSGYPDDALYRTIACVAHTSIPEHADRVRRLRLPTLVAWCDDDPMIGTEIAAELARACPDGPRHRFSKGGHNPQKTHAAELAGSMVTWLQELS